MGLKDPKGFQEPFGSECQTETQQQLIYPVADRTQ